MIRSVVLFAHVVGVLGLFVGLGVEWLSLNAVQRSTTRDEALRWVGVISALPRVMGVALAVIVASGFYLGARIGVIGDGWLRASYAALLVMGIVAVVVYTKVGVGILRSAWINLDGLWAAALILAGVLTLVT